MPETFSLPLNGTPHEALNRARETAATHGVILEGDDAAGRFCGYGVIGEYAIAEETITFTIQQRPAMISLNALEAGVRRLLG
jgi:hypothetical protein